MHPVLRSSVYLSTERMYQHYSKEVKKGLNSVQHLQNVVDCTTAKAAVTSLQKLCYRTDGNFHIFTGENGLCNRVTFNNQHETEFVKGFSYDYSKEVQTIIKVALDRFGKALKLEGEHEIAIQIKQTQISEFGIGPSRWGVHNDVSWIMYTLLSDPEDPIEGWNGGEFSRSTFYMQNKPIGIAQPTESIEKISHTFGGAILAHTFGILHRTEAMKPKSEEKNTSRTVLEIALIDHRNYLFDCPLSQYIESAEVTPMHVKLFEPSSNELRF